MSDMTGPEFKASLAKIGLTARQAGGIDFFGVTERQIFAWTSGKVPVNKLARRLVRVMLKYRLTVEDIEKLDRNK